MSIEEKRRLAQHVIDNSGTIEETRAQVEQLWPRLVEG
jgi:dephospho-CoA kinase